MRVTLKDLRKDTNLYYLEKDGCTLMCSGDFISKILLHPKVMPLWGVVDEDSCVDVRLAFAKTKLEYVWIDEFVGL